jgi:hypothetical protein
MAIQPRILREVNGLMHSLLQSYGRDTFSNVDIVKQVLGQVLPKEFLTNFHGKREQDLKQFASLPKSAPSLDIEGLDLDLLNKLLNEHKAKEAPKGKKPAPISA